MKYILPRSMRRSVTSRIPLASAAEVSTTLTEILEIAKLDCSDPLCQICDVNNGKEV